MRIVITGSTQGIGKGLAREFLQRGHRVLISSRNPERVAATREALSALPGTVAGQTCDVAVAGEVQALWDRALETFGGVDIWVNNAGLARTVWPILDVPQPELETMVTGNMLGTINGCRVAARGMLAQGGGKIFNMLGGGSDGEYFPGMGIYGTTKRGLNYFTDALVRELRDSPLVIAKIRPGMIITEAVIREIEADRDNFERSRNRMNTLVDTVATVAPYLVDEMLACEQSGRKIRWLSPAKITGRMLKSLFTRRPDQFEPFGL